MTLTEQQMTFADIVRGYSNDQLSEAFVGAQEAVATARFHLDVISDEARRRANQTGGRVVGGLDVTPGTPTYDIGRITALREEISEAEWAALVVKTIQIKDNQVPEEVWQQIVGLMPGIAATQNVNGHTANKLLRKHGPNSIVGKAISTAQVPGVARVSLRKED